jgi:hypothetical protein
MMEKEKQKERESTLKDDGWHYDEGLRRKAEARQRARTRKMLIRKRAVRGGSQGKDIQKLFSLRTE